MRKRLGNKGGIMVSSGEIESQKKKEKVLFIVSSICSISIIILVCMQFLGGWENATNLYQPLLGVLMLIQTIQNWKKSKVVAIMSLCATIFIFIVTISMIVNI